ncbi:MAG: pyrroline-5-carboxylate reductase [Coriobacteriales bacterium]|jgi:pyrroline-5-carboxylate reductase|nr:pyrroline-5-carboxylate reductase [Coriobacteriales bacterium]
MSSLAERLGAIALIGGGKMGEAIVSGLVNGALFDPESLTVADPGEARRRHLSEVYAVRCVADGSEIEGATTAILAVKPQVLRDICERLASAPAFCPTRVISIAAGITTTTLRSFFSDASIVRVMPNTPLMVGAGMSAVSTAEGTPRADGELVCSLFSLMGDAVLVEESQLDAVTALSGSGPAYFALFVEELVTAGAAAGLAPEVAQTLARQTLVGTARYLELTDITPAALREAVTSPGGTTAAALADFASHDFGGIVHSAVHAALRRAKELA